MFSKRIIFEEKLSCKPVLQTGILNQGQLPVSKTTLFGDKMAWKQIDWQLDNWMFRKDKMAW